MPTCSPHSRGAASACLVYAGALPFGILNLALLLFVRQRTGSIEVGGVVIAAFGLGNAVGLVVQGRFLDRGAPMDDRQRRSPVHLRAGRVCTLRHPVGAEKAVRGCQQDFSCHSPKGEDASSWCSRSSTWRSYAWSSSSASRAELRTTWRSKSSCCATR